MAILVTGAAGFIGAAVSKTLLDRSDAVVGLDSLYDYYDVVLKQARLERLKVLPRFGVFRSSWRPRSGRSHLVKSRPSEGRGDDDDALVVGSI